MGRISSLLLTLLLAGLNLVAVNLLLDGFSGARVDLTEERLYSISPATKRILRSLEDDVTIYGYFSQRTHPKLAPLVPQVEDLLEEYAALSRGRVHVEIIDPGEDDSAAEEARERFGVEMMPFRMASKYEAGVVNAYFSVVLRYGDQYERYGFRDLIRVEPLPDGEFDVRLRNLEYDLTRALKKVVYSFRGSEELFERVESPMRLTLLASEGLPEIFQEIPQAVRTAAAELQEKGGDKFLFRELDPSTDDALADEMYRKYQAAPMSVGFFGDSSFYLYGFLETEDRVEQLYLADEGISAATVREAIEDALRRQAPGFLKTVGLVVPEPELPEELMRQLQMQGQRIPQPPPEFEQVRRLLELDYQVTAVDLAAASGVPTEVDTLVVLRPENLPERGLYHLDQYLMRGGRVILCGGAFSAKLDAQGLRVDAVESGLDDWLSHLGVTIEKTLVLDDRNQSMLIPQTQMTALGPMRTFALEPYPYLVAVQEEGLVNDQLARAVGAVGLYWSSPISLDEERLAAQELNTMELLRSSERSWVDDDTASISFVDYEVPAEGTEPQLLAVALTGRFESYFKEREVPAGDTPPTADGEAPPSTDVALARSPETRLVVVSDADFLSDFVATTIGTTEGGFFEENLIFMQNLIDWTNLDNDMIGIRSRGAALRRLAPRESGKGVIEALNYAVPALLLMGLATLRWSRRRNVRPVVDPRPLGTIQSSGRVEP